MDLVEEVYMLTRRFPKEEQFGLTSQVRRAATSILANIAEGFSRTTAADKAHKYIIARGECSETHALILIPIRLKILTEDQTKKSISLCIEIGKMLTALIQNYSQQKSRPNPNPIP